MTIQCEQVLQLARQLSARDRLRLIGQLAPQLAADLEPADIADAPAPGTAIAAAEYEQALALAARQLAADSGQAPDELLIVWRQRIAAPLNASVDKDALARLEGHLGAVDLGRASGADATEIDVDLASAYANSHNEDG